MMVKTIVGIGLGISNQFLLLSSAIEYNEQFIYGSSLKGQADSQHSFLGSIIDLSIVINIQLVAPYDLAWWPPMTFKLQCHGLGLFLTNDTERCKVMQDV